MSGSGANNGVKMCIAFVSDMLAVWCERRGSCAFFFLLAFVFFFVFLFCVNVFFGVYSCCFLCSSLFVWMIYFFSSFCDKMRLCVCVCVNGFACREILLISIQSLSICLNC